MLYRSKAPLRIGLAGGGTDVSPYSDLYGGSILNATISLYARTTIELNNNNFIEIVSADQNKKFHYPLSTEMPIDGNMDLVKGVYNRIFQLYKPDLQGFKITTHVDAPAGSGLGTSSTLVVSILGAFVEWLKLPLGEYDIAHLAYEIERTDLNLAGGKQDQYAATFGGVNFMEFYADDKVIVNPLRIKSKYLNELQNNLVLFYTDTSRESAKIIEVQSQNVKDKKETSIEAMHQLKHQAQMMKEAILRGNVDDIGHILDFGFQQKKKMAEGISNSFLDELYDGAIKAGATGGKISGAGGGGFMIFYCPKTTRYDVIKKLSTFGGQVNKFQFVVNGLTTWSV